MAQSDERVVRLQKKSLKRVLGLGDLFAIGYGDVGSSIYYALGATALYALGATPIALLLAGCVFICTALTYTELSSTFTEPGGSTTFIRHACNDLISFIAGWGLLLDYIVTVAISSFAIPPYFRYVLQTMNISYPDTSFNHCAFTILIITGLFVVNLFGVKHSGRLSMMLAIFTIATQASIILLGALFFLNLPHVWAQMKVGVVGLQNSPDWPSFLKGCAMAMVAYTGIEAITQLASETKQPAITIPKAIRWTAFTVIFLYMGISWVGLSVMSPLDLGTTYIEDPIGGIVISFPVGGKILGPWVGMIAAVILLIAANAGLIGCSRLTFSMGEYYQVPDCCYKVHPRYQTPYVSLAIFAFLASGVVAMSRGKMLFLADLYNFGAQIAFFSVHIALLILRWKKPHLERPYRAPFNIPFGKGRTLPLTALLGAMATFCVWIVVIVTKVEGRILGFSWMTIGLLMYFFYRRKKKISPVSQLSVEKIQIPEYQPIDIKHILVAAQSPGFIEPLQTAFQMARTYKAKVTVVHVREIPYAIPIDQSSFKHEALEELILKQAEAISREFHLSIQLELIYARSIEKALLKLLESGSYDLMIVGSNTRDIKKNRGLSLKMERLLKEAPCRVLFYKS